MPSYVYTDGTHTQEVTHRMLYSTAVVCGECGAEMWRVPQPFSVNWNGLPPHKDNGQMRRWAADAPRRQDEMEEKYHARH